MITADGLADDVGVDPACPNASMRTDGVGEEGVAATSVPNIDGELAAPK